MSESRTVTVARLIAEPNGESRFEDASFVFQLQNFAPPAPPFLVTDPQAAQSFTVIELAVGWGGGEPHPAPARHMAFILSGAVRMTASSGEARDIVAGEGVLLEDTSGKGHVTEVISDRAAKVVMIRLP